ncbi:MAG TPA: AzlD domain-containing protein [Methanothermococcus okinawensis]|nr:AzlD domain-containing protein [Methanothermococcus okinawensis]
MEHYIAIVLVAIGTYLTRFLPLYFNERFKRLKDMDEFLSYSSTAIISALFITSLVSFPVDLKYISVSIVALTFVFLSYKKWKNLGISVLIGVIVHLLLSLIVMI